MKYMFPSLPSLSCVVYYYSCITRWPNFRCLAVFSSDCNQNERYSDCNQNERYSDCNQKELSAPLNNAKERAIYIYKRSGGLMIYVE